MSDRFWILFGVSLIVAVFILAVLRAAFRPDPRDRDPGAGRRWTVRTESVDLAAHFTPPESSPPPADSIDDGSDAWWAIGVLSDIRRRVAAGDVPPLEEPVTWLALMAGWERVKNLGTRRPPANVGPHGGTGWAFAAHAHQATDALDHDGRYLAEVPA